MVSSLYNKKSHFKMFYLQDMDIIIILLQKSYNIACYKESSYLRVYLHACL